MVISWYIKLCGVIIVAALMGLLYFKAEYAENKATTRKIALMEAESTIESLKGKLLESQTSIKVLETGNRSLESRVYEAEGMLSTCANGYDKLREDLGKVKNVPKQKVAEYYGVDFDSGAALLRQYNDDINRLRSTNKD